MLHYSSKVQFLQEASKKDWLFDLTIRGDILHTAASFAREDTRSTYQTSYIKLTIRIKWPLIDVSNLEKGPNELISPQVKKWIAKSSENLALIEFDQPNIE